MTHRCTGPASKCLALTSCWETFIAYSNRRIKTPSPPVWRQDHYSSNCLMSRKQLLKFRDTLIQKLCNRQILSKWTIGHKSRGKKRKADGPNLTWMVSLQLSLSQNKRGPQLVSRVNSYRSRWALCGRKGAGGQSADCTGQVGFVGLFEDYSRSMWKPVWRGLYGWSACEKHEGFTYA